MQMINLCKLSLSQLKERWSHDDPEVVGDEMIEYARYVQSHNIMPVKGIETLIGPYIIRECGIRISRSTIDWGDSTSINTVFYLGRGKYFTHIMKDKSNRILEESVKEVF
jgi:hypothetical protein